jgi:glycosyltransferase involved in cell wall biosynthesis
MKIGLVNKHYKLGGVETVVNQLRHGLRARGIRTQLWVSEYFGVPRDPSAHLLYPVVLDRIQHSRLAGYAEHYFPRRDWTTRKFRTIQRSESDLIHVHGFDETYAPIEALLELAHAKPVVVTLHGTWFFTGGCGQPLECDRYTNACGRCPQAGNWPIPATDNTAEELEKKKRLLSDVPIHFISPSAHLRAKALNSTVGKNWNILHLPNGVDTKLFRGERKHDSETRQAYGVNQDRVVVLAMCRDFRDPVKGVPLMVGALKLLEAANIQIILAGAFGGVAASELPDFLHPTPVGYVVNDNVRRDLFEIADVFLFTSLAETFPCVVLEAMSSECCIVSTPVEGVREQLQHGKSGLLAEKFTSQSIAETLMLACEAQDQTAELGRRARVEVLERFTEETMLSEHESLYRRLAE